MFAWCQWPSAAFSEMMVEKKYSTRGWMRDSSSSQYGSPLEERLSDCLTRVGRCELLGVFVWC